MGAILGVVFSAWIISLVASFVLGVKVSVFKVILIGFILYLVMFLIVLVVSGPIFLIDKCVSIFKLDKKNKQRKEI